MKSLWPGSAGPLLSNNGVDVEILKSKISAWEFGLRVTDLKIRSHSFSVESAEYESSFFEPCFEETPKWNWSENGFDSPICPQKLYTICPLRSRRPANECKRLVVLCRTLFHPQLGVKPAICLRGGGEKNFDQNLKSSYWNGMKHPKMAKTANVKKQSFSGEKMFDGKSFFSENESCWKIAAVSCSEISCCFLWGGGRLVGGGPWTDRQPHIAVQDELLLAAARRDQKCPIRNSFFFKSLQKCRNVRTKPWFLGKGSFSWGIDKQIWAHCLPGIELHSISRQLWSIYIFMCSTSHLPGRELHSTLRCITGDQALCTAQCGQVVDSLVCHVQACSNAQWAVLWWKHNAQFSSDRFLPTSHPSIWILWSDGNWPPHVAYGCRIYHFCCPKSSLLWLGIFQIFL